MRMTASVANSRVRTVATAQETFPPLSTSLEPFVKDGTDREFRRLIFSLLTLFDLMQRNRKYFADYVGLTDAQYMMMVLIADDPGMTVGRLAERLNVSSPFVTAEIARLIKKTIVGKRPNEADRRSMLLTLTPKGETLLCELGPVRRRINDLTFNSLTQERARLLQDIVDGLVADARNAVHEITAPHMRGKRAPSAQADVADDTIAGSSDQQRARRSNTRR